MKTPDKPVVARASELVTPQLGQLPEGSEPAPPDWRIEYGSTLNPDTEKVELPAPSYTRCPYPDCPECETEKGT